MHTDIYQMRYFSSIEVSERNVPGCMEKVVLLGSMPKFPIEVKGRLEWTTDLQKQYQLVTA